MSHAILSPSGASRWLACSPSARLEQKFPDKTSSYAEEGTLAHSLGELLIKEKAGYISQSAFKHRLKELEESEYYNDSMLEYCDEYATFVMEQYSIALNNTPDAMLFLEAKLNLTDYVPEGFGTGDVVIISDGILTLVDLKYGKGVAVSSENNKQMMLYALGALCEYDYMYDIDTVQMTIYQPRIRNISTWELSVAELKQWAEVELKPKAAKAFAGEGEFIAGTHCQFCKAKAKCKALAETNLEIAKYEFAKEVFLSDQEIADILERADMFTSWINAVQEYALAEALNGKKWPGRKLVEGRSNRKYLDDQAVANILLAKGFTESTIYTSKLLGITAMEKEIGKKEFNLFLSDMIIKPAGKPTLVPATDKRPEYSGVESAKLDFA